jgi:hypothetical protein
MNRKVIMLIHICEETIHDAIGRVRAESFHLRLKLLPESNLRQRSEKQRLLFGRNIVCLYYQNQDTFWRRLLLYTDFFYTNLQLIVIRFSRTDFGSFRLDNR